MVEFYLLTFPRFPLRKKEHQSYFGKNRTHDFRTSRCAGYLLDHSGDEGTIRLLELVIALRLTILDYSIDCNIIIKSFLKYLLLKGLFVYIISIET